MPERPSCFVIMPYSESSDRMYAEAIAPALAGLPGSGVIALRADQIGRRSLTLRAHVEAAIRVADFCIVDLTGNNPNVMYELGYAAALQKPVVLIREHADGEPPADLRESEILEYDPGRIEPFRVTLGERCARILGATSVRQPERQDIALPALEPGKGVAVLDRFVTSVTTRLSALVFSSEPLVEELLPKLHARALRGLSVRLLCADPESEFWRGRAQDLGVDLARLRSGLWRGLKELQTKARVFEGTRVEIRTTEIYPSNTIYLSDQMCCLVPHMASHRSRATTAILFGREAQIYVLLEREFEYAWSRSRSPAADGARL